MVTVADRYDLLEPLGHGGMARVYSATDRVLGRQVALKLLRDDIGRDDVLRERFLREARLAAGLTHRHIVRVYDAGVDDATPWIAMELVDGPSLREEMSRRGPYPADEAVELIAQVLDALAAAHAAGVVHRDIKPANILLGADGPKLGDFGIAKSLEGGADLTQTNQFMGTPKYTAPEVAMGLAATPQSDVYAAGVLLWEVLAGFPPYEHENPLALAMMHRTDPLPSLASVRPDLPTALVAAIEMGLAKEPPDRPTGAAAFAALLHDGLAGRAAAAQTAVMARVPTPPPPPVPPVREQTAVMARPQPRPVAAPPPARPSRNRVPGIALVVVLLLVLAALAASRLDLGTDAPAPSEVPVPTTPATPTEPTATEAPAPAPAPVVEPTPAPTTPPPTQAPTPEPVPAPTPEPTPTPLPTADPTPEPTAQEDPPLIPVPGIGGGG